MVIGMRSILLYFSRLGLVGGADTHLLPPGSARFHWLPPILATTIGRHKLKRPRSANPQASLRIDGRHCRLGLTRKAPVGEADGHMLPVGQAEPAGGASTGQAHPSAIN